MEDRRGRYYVEEVRCFVIDLVQIDIIGIKYCVCVVPPIYTSTLSIIFPQYFVFCHLSKLPLRWK